MKTEVLCGTSRKCYWKDWALLPLFPTGCYGHAIAGTQAAILHLEGEGTCWERHVIKRERAWRCELEYTGLTTSGRLFLSEYNYFLSCVSWWLCLIVCFCSRCMWLNLILTNESRVTEEAQVSILDDWTRSDAFSEGRQSYKTIRH